VRFEYVTKIHSSFPTGVTSMTSHLSEGFRTRPVGLIPAAGQASRIAPLPCSKELCPVGFTYSAEGLPLRPKVACQYVLEKMQRAGIELAYVILRRGKFDIPAYLNDGRMVNMHLAYLMMDLPFGVPFTLDQAYPFVKDATVALGFPDMLFDPDEAFTDILKRLRSSESDVTLGLFPTANPHKTDMVELAGAFAVRRIVVKPPATDLELCWGIAAWTSTFSNFMHGYLKSLVETGMPRSEVFMGHVFQAAIDTGLRVEGLQVSDNPFLDIGTPDDLVTALRLSVSRQP
jgi:glucose-1-phosphate thymidylyltransferase